MSVAVVVTIGLTSCAGEGQLTTQSINDRLMSGGYQGACEFSQSGNFDVDFDVISCTSSVDSSFDVRLRVFDSESDLLKFRAGSADLHGCDQQVTRVGSNAESVDTYAPELEPFFSSVRTVELSSLVEACAE